MSFTSLGLSAPILKAVAAQGYKTPSPIQAQAIPAVLQGRDIMAAAQTGTGKTAGFTLPLLHILSQGKPVTNGQIRALIITPTRELAAQIAESVANYGAKLPLKSAVVFGGVSINPQITKLKNGVDILVATPGRLLDLYQQRAISFQSLEILVLDEADRMLDMGFIHDIRRILKVLPPKRQNLLFSATFSEEIRALAKGLVNNPLEISVTPRNTTAETVKQWICPVDKSQKSALLTNLIKDQEWKQVLVFSRTKHGANRLAKHLEGKGIRAAAIHGNKSQNARTQALADFKSGKARVLVATDIAARGLDIEQLPQVVNFDLPNVPEDYVHRIGRTGRAGASGQAVSLVSADEFKLLHDIEKLINQKLVRKEFDGFAPTEQVPETSANTAQKKRSPSKSGQSDRRVNNTRDNTSTNANANSRNSQPKSPRRQGQSESTSKETNESVYRNSKKPFRAANNNKAPLSGQRRNAQS